MGNRQFRPLLYRTHDGVVHWTKIPGESYRLRQWPGEMIRIQMPCRPNTMALTAVIAADDAIVTCLLCTLFKESPDVLRRRTP